MQTYIHTNMHVYICTMNNENTINANAHAKGRIAQSTTTTTTQHIIPTGRGNEWESKRRIDQTQLMQKEHGRSEWESEQLQREYAWGWLGSARSPKKPKLYCNTHAYTQGVWVWVPGWVSGKPALN